MFDCVPKTPPWPLKKKEILYDFTYFYNFINWPVFYRHRQPLHYNVAIE